MMHDTYDRNNEINRKENRTFWKRLVMSLLVSFHFVIMIVIFTIFWLRFYRLPAVHGSYFVHNRTVFAVYTILLFVMSRFYTCYRVGLVKRSDLYYNQCLANLVCWGITYVIVCIMAQQFVNPWAGFVAYALQCIFAVFWILLANAIYFRMHRAKRTIVIFRKESDLRKLGEIQNFENKWNVVKRVQCIDAVNVHDIPDTQADELKLSDLADESVEHDIHKIIPLMEEVDTVFLSGVNATLRNGIVKYCVERRKDCFFVPHTGDVIISGATHIQSFAVPIMRARRARLSPEFLFAKRLFDIVISLIAILLLSPFMIITAIAIKLYDHGPVIYKQVRLTKDGREFEILKFRSMRQDAEKDGVARLSTGTADDRITPIGKVIRAIRFDELPQLINILKGDMSIVGPRPERPEIAAQYEKELPAFGLRLQVKAGLTGYAQIYGKYNTEPSDKLKMDLMYINNIGMLEDLKLIFATVGILFKRESTTGIEDGKVTAMDEKTMM